MTTDTTIGHENLSQLHRWLFDAAIDAGAPVDLAAPLVRAQVLRLQTELAGARIGRRDFYVPVVEIAVFRQARIREAMGPAPHSRARARQVAQAEGCSERTVWRAIGGQGPAPEQASAAAAKPSLSLAAPRPAHSPP